MTNVNDNTTPPKPLVLMPKPSLSVRSFKVYVYVDDEWVTNGLRFDNEQQAGRYADDLSARWVKVKSYDIQPSTEAPNAQMLRFGQYEKSQDAPGGA